ncbi:RNase H domain-containing protein [Trichonephila clavipes]|nr:RNase H domain-containing protein [Trichonephila clavipes]
MRYGDGVDLLFTSLMSQKTNGVGTKTRSGICRYATLANQRWSYCNLYWVKAHNNNLYNDYADFYAKQAVYDGEVFSVPAPSSFLSSSSNKFILESWTPSWNDCNTGLRVKRFFNNPNLNILPLSKYLVNFLTNHGPFPAYLRRFNLLSSPNCLCGSPGDANHYVFHCPFTSDHHLVNPIPNALYP